MTWAQAVSDHWAGCFLLIMAIGWSIANVIDSLRAPCDCDTCDCECHDNDEDNEEGDQS